MPREQFEDYRFRPETLDIIDQANKIIGEYTSAGYVLTLRQLYYQFVARDLLPNSQQSYNNLGSVINKARLAGCIDWYALEDRTRNLRKLPTWENPTEIVKTAAEQFRLDKWADQDDYVEVWIEKDALLGVIEGVCERWQVPYFSCRGYTSQSEQYRAGRRLYDKMGEHDVTVLHLGDHDPSGMDMTRDNQDRLDRFTYFEGVTVKRLALNMEQVEIYEPPPNPAKFSDSRATDYVARFGRSCWELDALDPPTMTALIENAILEHLDMEKWDAMVRRENEAKYKIEQAAKALEGEDA